MCDESARDGWTERREKRQRGRKREEKRMGGAQCMVRYYITHGCHVSQSLWNWLDKPASKDCDIQRKILWWKCIGRCEELITHLQGEKMGLVVKCVCTVTSWCRLQQGSIWSRWDHPRHSRGLWPDNSQHILSHRGHTDAVWPGPHPLLSWHTAVAVESMALSINIETQFDWNNSSYMSFMPLSNLPGLQYS